MVVGIDIVLRDTLESWLGTPPRDNLSSGTDEKMRAWGRGKRGVGRREREIRREGMKGGKDNAMHGNKWGYTR